MESLRVDWFTCRLKITYRLKSEVNLDMNQSALGRRTLYTQLGLPRFMMPRHTEDKNAAVQNVVRHWFHLHLSRRHRMSVDMRRKRLSWRRCHCQQSCFFENFILPWREPQKTHRAKANKKQTRNVNSKQKGTQQNTVGLYIYTIEQKTKKTITTVA